MAKWLRFAWCLGLAVSLLAGGSQFLAAQEPAESKPAADAFVVPDGPTEKLLEFLRATRRFRPAPDLSPLEKRLTMIRALEAMAQASEKILAASPDEEIALEAISSRFQALGVLSQAGRREAAKQLDEFAASLANDARPAVQAEVLRHQLEQRVREFLQPAEEPSPAQTKQQAQRIHADAIKWLEKAQPSGQIISLIMQIGEGLSRAQEPALAAEVLQQGAAVIAKADNPDLAAYSAKLAGSARRANLVGHPIEIAGKKLDGKPLDWASYRGKVVLIDFWATWCGPCIAELPNMRAVYEQYHPRGFEVVGISLDNSRERLDSFMEQSGLPWTILFSDDAENTGWDHPMAVKFGVMSIPQMILVDRSGKVVTLNARGEALGDFVSKLVAEESNTAEPAEKK